MFIYASQEKSSLRIKTLIKNVFLLNFLNELLISFLINIYKRAGVLYQRIQTRREAGCFRC